MNGNNLKSNLCPSHRAKYRILNQIDIIFETDANVVDTPLLELQTGGYHGSFGPNGGFNGVSHSAGGSTFRTMGGYPGSSHKTEERMGPVMMVYSLDPDKFNCQKLFNLLCLYGNVAKINFLKSKEGVAMVEFDDGISVERACHNLSQTKVFGAKLRLEPSRKERVEDIRKPHELSDGTDSFESFFRDRNNRYRWHLLSCNDLSQSGLTLQSAQQRIV